MVLYGKMSVVHMFLSFVVFVGKLILPEIHMNFFFFFYPLLHLIV